MDEKTRLAQLQEACVNRLNHGHQRPGGSHLISPGFFLEGEKDKKSEAREGSSHINQLMFGDQWSNSSPGVPNSELGPWSDRRCQITGCGFYNYRGNSHIVTLAHSPSASWRLAL